MWSVLIAAAGASARMGGVDKLALPLGGKPVLWHALNAFRATGWFARAAVVTLPARRQLLEATGLGPGCPVDWVAGGARRQDSVANGLRHLAAFPEIEWVAIHDGARPFAEPGLIRRVLDAAARVGAAAPGIPVWDSLRQLADGELAGPAIEREGLVRVQTPQAFPLRALLRAHERLAASGQEVSDDVTVYQMSGRPVAIVRGAERNVKITTPEDIVLAAPLLAGPPAG